MSKRPLEDSFFDNSNFKDIIMNKKYFEPLEDILNEELDNHDWFLKNKYFLDWGFVPNKTQLGDIFSELKPAVLKFLDVKDIPDVPYGYFSLFNRDSDANRLLFQYFVAGLSLAMVPPPFNLLGLLIGGFTYKEHRFLRQDDSYRSLEGKIRLAKKETALLKPIFAHEYTHHVQYVHGTDFTRSRIFPEGHARGIQREIATRLSKKENNKAYLFQPTYFAVMELGNVYNLMCSRLGRNPKKSLVGRIICNLDYLEFPHSYGNTLMYVLERMHGKKIYSKVLKGDMSFFR